MKQVLHWYAANPSFTAFICELLLACLVAAALYHYNHRPYRRLMPKKVPLTEQERTVRGLKRWRITFVVGLVAAAVLFIGILALVFVPSLQQIPGSKDIRLYLAGGIVAAAILCGIAGLRSSYLQQQEYLFIKHFEG